ncbi:hypothetical protein [Nostoc sp. UHCC 0870]|uniref:hypothetical protein n=1 Tax=Nostoc sp. UHCC 0870 TaxID=2914041 RepID=UPI0030DAE969
MYLAMLFRHFPYTKSLLTLAARDNQTWRKFSFNPSTPASKSVANKLAIGWRISSRVAAASALQVISCSSLVSSLTMRYHPGCST